MTLRRRRLLGLGAAAALTGAAGVVAGKLVADQSRQPATFSAFGQPFRLAGVGEPVARFGMLGGPLAWDPTGRQLAVEQFSKDNTRTVSLYEVGSWSKHLEIPGSRPSWSTDATHLALVRPFPATTPPTSDTVVVLIDPASGAVVETIAARTSDVGWSGDQPYGVVEGRVVPLRAQTNSVVTCADGCDLAEWAPVGDYLAVGNAAIPSEYVIASVRDPALRKPLGAAGGLVWAARAPVLAWQRSDATFAWTMTEGERQVPLAGGLRPAAWSPDGTMLLCSSLKTSWVQWSRLDNQITALALPAAFGAAVHTWWSSDGRFIATVPQSFGPAEAVVYATVITPS